MADLSRLHKLISDGYGLDDLRMLCFTLGVDYKSLLGKTREQEILERQERTEQSP